MANEVKNKKYLFSAHFDCHGMLREVIMTMGGQS